MRHRAACCASFTAKRLRFGDEAMVEHRLPRGRCSGGRCRPLRKGPRRAPTRSSNVQRRRDACSWTNRQTVRRSGIQRPPEPTTTEQQHHHAHTINPRERKNESRGEGGGSQGRGKDTPWTVQRTSVSSVSPTAALTCFSLGGSETGRIRVFLGVWSLHWVGVAGFDRMYREGGLYLHRPACVGCGGTEWVAVGCSFAVLVPMPLWASGRSPCGSHSPGSVLPGSLPLPHFQFLKAALHRRERGPHTATGSLRHRSRSEHF